MSFSQSVMVEGKNSILIADVLARYDFQVKSLKQFKGIYLLETTAGLRCLKKVFYGEEDLRFVTAAMLYLQDQGFTNLASVVLNKEGRPYLKTGEGCFLVTEYIHGREADYANPLDLKLAAQTLAKLHLNSSGFVAPPAPQDRFRWGRWIEIFMHRTEELCFFRRTILQKEEMDPYDETYLKHLDYFIDQAEKACQGLMDSPYLKVSRRREQTGGFCHHDVAYHNILISSDRTPHFIDFDYCVCDLHLHDLASLLLRNGKRSCWNFKVAANILSAYHAVFPLTEEDILVMREFLRFPQDFWQLGVWRYVEKQPWPLEKYMSLLKRKTCDKKEKEAFLKGMTEIQYTR